MKQIIVIKPKSLSSKDKEKLTKAGNIVIEHDKPSEIHYHNIHESNDSYVYVNCYLCGDRVYVLSERLAALKSKKGTFYCSRGHSQAYS